MKQKKTVHVLGYEFDSLPAHVKLTGRGSGATLRVACQRAIADLFTQHQLRHKQTGAFKLSVVVIAESKTSNPLVEGCAEHNLPLVDGRCPKCRDKNGNTFVLDMQSKVLLRPGGAS